MDDLAEEWTREANRRTRDVRAFAGRDRPTRAIDCDAEDSDLRAQNTVEHSRTIKKDTTSNLYSSTSQRAHLVVEHSDVSSPEHCHHPSTATTRL